MTLQERLQVQEILRWGTDNPAYWEAIKRRAKALHTDGCSGPTLQVFVYACWEHDIHYRTHQDFNGRPITREQADYIFRERHKQWSKLDGYSPMAHWRWFFLRMFGEHAWEAGDKGSPYRCVPAVEVTAP